MASLTSSDVSKDVNVSPNLGLTEQSYKVTADSGDTIDISDSSVVNNTLSSIEYVHIYDQTDGDYPSATWSGTTITIDSGGGSTGNTYFIRVIGEK